MSLGRVSYLESWEHHPPPFIRRPSFGDGAASGDEESINRHSRTQSPDPHFFPSSLPSSFPSRAVRHKLSFNPVAGRGWAHSFANELDEEQRPLFRSDVSPDLTIRDAVPARLAEEGIAAEHVFQDPKWDTAETTPAFVVNSGKRIRRLYILALWWLLVLTTRYSSGDCGSRLLLACCWPSLWFCSYQTGIYTRGGVSKSVHQ
jgi:hypothetical protein